MDMTGLHEECCVPLLDDVAVILRHTPEIRRDFLRVSVLRNFSTWHFGTSSCSRLFGET